MNYKKYMTCEYCGIELSEDKAFIDKDGERLCDDCFEKKQIINGNHEMFLHDKKLGI